MKDNIFIYMNQETKQIDVTPAIYIAVMVLVFILGTIS